MLKRYNSVFGRGQVKIFSDSNALLGRILHAEVIIPLLMIVRPISWELDLLRY
jgi:hypothetical protein